MRTRNLEQVRIAFQDLLDRMGTDYIDLGMIHFVDEKAEFRRIMEGEFIDYVKRLKAQGVIRHIGISTHNPEVARLAALSGVIEMILFSVNPAFDLLPASEDLNEYFKETYEEQLGGIAPEREELYRICEREGVGITVMKGVCRRAFVPGGNFTLRCGSDSGSVSALCAYQACGGKRYGRI